LQSRTRFRSNGSDENHTALYVMTMVTGISVHELPLIAMKSLSNSPLRDK